MKIRLYTKILLLLLVVTCAAVSNGNIAKSSNGYKNAFLAMSQPCVLVGVYGYNNSANRQYIQIFDTNAIPADGATNTLFTVFVAGPTNNFYWTVPDGAGANMSMGVVVNNSSTITNKTVGSADCWFTVVYRAP